MKIGISNNNDKDKIEYVIGKVEKQKLDKINEANKFAKDIIDDFISLDFDKVMSKYNKRG